LVVLLHAEGRPLALAWALGEEVGDHK